MATQVTLDAQLVATAIKLGNFDSAQAAVTQALHEYIQHHSQAEILQLFGKIEYVEDYNHRYHRQR